MSDLISRSALIEAVVNSTGSPTVLFNTAEELEAYFNGCKFKQNEIIDMIDNFPTAYNVDAVIKELGEYRDFITIQGRGFVDGAISIVRKGGV